MTALHIRHRWKRLWNPNCRHRNTNPAYIAEIDALQASVRTGHWTIRWRGPIAQDVQKDRPDAVHVGPGGFLMVDFGKLGYLPEVVAVERIEPLNVPVPPWFQARQEHRENAA